jgi:hypothetical protein
MEPAERMGRLETRMDRVEEGVSNFRLFQAKAAEFYVLADERAENEMEFHNTRDQEIKDALRARERSLNHRLAVIGIILTLMGLWPIFKDIAHIKLSFNSPAVQSTQNAGGGEVHY